MNNNFSFAHVKGRGLLLFKNEAVLEGISLTVGQRRGGTAEYFVKDIYTEEGKTVMEFAVNERMSRLRLLLTQEEGAAQIYAEARCGETLSYEDFTFSGENSLFLRFTYAKGVEGALSSSLRDNPFWQMPSFETDLSKINPRTQSVLVKSGALHTHLLALPCNNWRANFCAEGLVLSAGHSRLTQIEGFALAISAHESPYAAIAQNFSAAKKAGAIRVALRKEREYPSLFNGFGFCTWDAFYNEVSAEKIFEKLAEFKKKEIPVQWVIIDDGWSVVEGGRLRAFEADEAKFPGGLRACIGRMKEEFGVKYVGVWHAFAAYWCGIDKGSPLYEAQKENLTVTPTGWVIPSVNPEKAFAFFDAWHSYLRGQGVDFVKVDAQSGLSPKFDEILPSAEGVARLHGALEKSVEKNFGGVMINCMGMDFENILNRPCSALNRNSNDFYPHDESSLINHIVQNVYFAPVHAQIHYCDFDMWWSGQKSAVQSGVLRAVSGGPIYVSDKIGGTNPGAIWPCIDEGGAIYRCEDAAMPTPDCLYADCVKEKRAVKVFNRFKENFVLAAFCLNKEGCKEEITLAHLPGAPEEGEYVAQEFFSKKLVRFHKGAPLNLSLAHNETALWNIYRVEKGEAGLGREDKYIGITAVKKRVLVKNIL